MKPIYTCLIVLLFLTSCTEKSEISDILDLRDKSISHQDINLYASLRSQASPKLENAQSIEKVKSIFSRFDAVEMKSRDRVIQIVDDNHAMCEQTYILRVFADGEWRKIVQREQLKLRKENGAWKIISGL